MKKLRFVNLSVLIVLFATLLLGYAKADAILITSKGDKGNGHTSLISQDEKGTWYYFFWGIDTAYRQEIDIALIGDLEFVNPLESLDDFNKWLYYQKKEKLKPDKTQNYYTRGTYIIGDFSETTKEYTNRVNNHSRFRYFAGLNFCSVITRQALEKATLNDGTSFKNLLENHKTVSDFIPFFLDFPVNLHNLVDRSVKNTVYEGRPNWGKITDPIIRQKMLNGGTGSSS